jgi:hypothetical protein
VNPTVGLHISEQKKIISPLLGIDKLFDRLKIPKKPSVNWLSGHPGRFEQMKNNIWLYEQRPPIKITLCVCYKAKRITA